MLTLLFVGAAAFVAGVFALLITAMADKPMSIAGIIAIKHR